MLDISVPEGEKLLMNFRYLSLIFIERRMKISKEENDLWTKTGRKNEINNKKI